MVCVVQRVSQASVLVDGQSVAAVPGTGLVVLCGILTTDSAADAAWMAEKIINLRIFPDDLGKMNKSVLEVGGSVLLVPNFTLAGETAKGRRPSFDKAMRPESAAPMFAAFIELVRGLGVSVVAGVFQTHMHVQLVNDGPITLIVDSVQRPGSGAPGLGA